MTSTASIAWLILALPLTAWSEDPFTAVTVSITGPDTSVPFMRSGPMPATIHIVNGGTRPLTIPWNMPLVLGLDFAPGIDVVRRISAPPSEITAFTSLHIDPGATVGISIYLTNYMDLLGTGMVTVHWTLALRTAEDFANTHVFRGEIQLDVGPDDDKALTLIMTRDLERIRSLIRTNAADAAPYEHLVDEIMSIRSSLRLDFARELLGIPEVRQQTVLALGLFDTRESTALLESILVPTVDAQTFTTVTSFLLRCGRMLPPATLRPFLKSSDAGLRRAAREYILYIMRPLNLELLIMDELDEDPTVRQETQKIYELLPPRVRPTPTANGF